MIHLVLGQGAADGVWARGCSGRGAVRAAAAVTRRPTATPRRQPPVRPLLRPSRAGRSLHSSTFQLNLCSLGHTCPTPVSPCLIDWVKIVHPTCPMKCAYFEPKIGRV